MRIQHNITALNSYRNYSNNTSAVSKNLEKLSSGYRINRAGDDAAGLAISEKMRAQITGLETAVKNANDGISLIQTAEGALTEVHSMLNRMLELADQSANGTYDNEVDRANLQKEVAELKNEVDRISRATNFNGINLLDGNLGGYKGTFDGDVTTITGMTISGGDLGAGEVKVTAAATGVTGVEVDGKTFANLDGVDVVDGITAKLSDDGSTITFSATKAATVEDADKFNGLTITISAADPKTLVAGEAKFDITGKQAGLKLQIGDTSDSFNQLTINVDAMDTKGLGIDKVTVADQKSASDAVKTIKDAINSVSSTRGNLGANQNRLEHTINNLAAMTENITEAESSIRDVDVAKEMMAYTKNNILVQSAQAMLAQANQLPQGVLQLLQ